MTSLSAPGTPTHRDVEEDDTQGTTNSDGDSDKVVGEKQHEHEALCRIRESGEIQTSATEHALSPLSAVLARDSKVLNVVNRQLVELVVLDQRFYMVLFDIFPHCGVFLFTRFPNHKRMRRVAKSGDVSDYKYRNAQVLRFTYDIDHEAGVPSVIRKCYRALPLAHKSIKHLYNRLICASVYRYEASHSSTTLVRKILTAPPTTKDALSDNYRDGVRDCEVPNIYALVAFSLQTLLYKIPVACGQEYQGSAVMHQHPMNHRVMKMCQDFVSCVTVPQSVMTFQWPLAPFQISYKLSPDCTSSSLAVTTTEATEATEATEKSVSVDVLHSAVSRQLFMAVPKASRERRVPEVVSTNDDTLGILAKRNSRKRKHADDDDDDDDVSGTSHRHRRTRRRRVLNDIGGGKPVKALSII